jgi:hypothetical protein
MGFWVMNLANLSVGIRATCIKVAKGNVPKWMRI